ncbi:MAG: hypothetical protein ACMUIG_09340 [Thermoplasmatota archaeon]
MYTNRIIYFSILIIIIISLSGCLFIASDDYDIDTVSFYYSQPLILTDLYISEEYESEINETLFYLNISIKELNIKQLNPLELLFISPLSFRCQPNDKYRGNQLFRISNFSHDVEYCMKIKIDIISDNNYIKNLEVFNNNELNVYFTIKDKNKDELIMWSNDIYVENHEIHIFDIFIIYAKLPVATPY